MPLVRGDNVEPLYVMSCIIIYGDIIALSIKLSSFVMMPITQNDYNHLAYPSVQSYKVA